MLGCVIISISLLLKWLFGGRVCGVAGVYRLKGGCCPIFRYKHINIRCNTANERGCILF